MRLIPAAILLCLGTQAYSAQDRYETAQGLSATTAHATICGVVNHLTYTQRHRSGTVERSLHCAKGWQADHGLPLSAGGADDVKNLSCQPPDKLADDHMGWQTKDKLDDWAWYQICRHGAKPSAIQAMFLPPAKWPESYCEVFHDKRC